VRYLVDLTTGKFSGTLVKVAANGDRLYEYVTDHFTATGSVGSSVITGGTGRFENATGEANFVSMWINAHITAVITFDGTISF
jgi:hypothetical protein